MSHYSSGNNQWDDLFEDDEGGEGGADGENESFPYWMNKDAVIFMIDASPLMFEANDSGEIAFESALRGAIDMMTRKIITNDSDLMAVCFYGTKERKNPNDFDGIYLLFDLDVPDAQRILTLEELIRKDFDATYGHFEGEFPFHDALWTCSTIFSNCTTKVGSKRIFLFTNNDNPNPDNVHNQNMAKQRAEDLAKLDIELELFSIQPPGKKFNHQVFFASKILVVDEDEAGAEKMHDAAEKFEQLTEKIRHKQFKKRSQGKVSFWVSPDIELAVRIYNTIQEAKKGSYMNLQASTNLPIKTQTKYICSETATPLMDTQIKHAFPYGGQSVFFEKEEIAAIKALDKPGIRLMGFKPMESLKDHYNVKHASFIYPDEAAIKGSTTAFSALLDRMLALNKIAICRWTPRSNSPPKFVALYPTREQFDKDGYQTSSPGFYVITLPFVEDIRNLKFETMPQPEQEVVDKASKVVAKLRINFQSKNFENPALQKHYIGLQAMALDRQVEGEATDFVQPDEEGMMKFADVINAFGQAVFPPGYHPDPKKTPQKGGKKTASKKRARPSDADDDEPTPKRAKTAEDPSQIDWAEHVENGTLSKLTLPQLKSYMKWKNVKGFSSMKKGELVDQITQMVTSGAVKKEKK